MEEIGMANRSRRPTISDIASAAGVSKTTVSRYINGRRELMSEKTRERIQAVIELSNYQPSDVARSLKMQRTNLIGVLVADMSSPFSSAVLGAVGEYLNERGYMPLIADANKSLKKEKELIDLFISKNVAGLIVNTTSFSNDYLIEVACQGLPVVLCDRYVDKYNFNIVTTESDHIICQLVQHLKDEGYTRPVMFSQKWENNSARSRRRTSFISAVKQIYGYDPSDDIFVVDGNWGLTARAQLEHLLARLGPNEIPAVFGVNTVTTIKAYKAIKEKGLKIPYDIGLCGPEDWNWQSEMNWPLLVEPSITTIAIPAKEIGSQSARILTQLLENKDRPVEELLLPSELKIRQSTSRNT